MKRQQSIIPWMVVQENVNPPIKEVIQMKRREGLRSWMCTMVIAVTVICMALLPVQAKAGGGGTSYTITASAGPNGKITPSGNVSVKAGNPQGFTITANPNCSILDVKLDGVSKGPMTSYTFTNVQAKHTIQATFCNGSIYTITASAGPNGSITPAGSVQVCQGYDQTFTIVPNANFTLENVTVDQPPPLQFPAYTYTFKSVSAPHTISASFASDSDNDGLSDAQEQAGITLGDGTPYPPCTQGMDRTLCVDPATKDLFLILVPASGSLLPSNPLEFVTKSQSQGGLGIAVHLISQNQVLTGSDRNVTPSQKVVRVTEIVDTSASNVLGESDGCGTPNGMDNARIYTKRIIDFVNSKYTGAPQSLIDTYIKQVIAHEIGHTVGPLKSPYDANCGGYHYCTIQPPGTNVIMEQSVYYSGITFYIGTIYTTADQGNVKLK